MLSDRMDTMQSSISALQSENDRLQSISLDLENDNQTLRSTLSEQNTHREWKRFDIIERHYKQLEQHRQRRLSGDFGSCSGTDDADSAAGSLRQEDNGTSTPRDENDLEFSLAEGVQTRSMATPRTPQSGITSPTPTHRDLEFRPDTFRSPVPQSPDVAECSSPGGLNRSPVHAPVVSLGKSREPTLSLTEFCCGAGQNGVMSPKLSAKYGGVASSRPGMLLENISEVPSSGRKSER
mmetsp:Transcript_83232/g.269427  ORF Transcript_83232/g.269427 Transcript_83232/m.269427 type:complete len:237 (+) Transcript_83232:186-896(+)